MASCMGMCSRHPEEKLRFMCTKCNTAICRDCKMTRHEGHPTTDLDLVVSDLRHRLVQEQEDVHSCWTSAKLLQDRMKSALTTLDSSVEEERSTVGKKVEAVVEWAQTYRRIMDKKMKDLQQTSRAQMESMLDHLHDNVIYLDQVNAAMSKALKRGKADIVAQMLMEYEEKHKGRFTADWEMTLQVSAHSWILSNTATKPDLCQSAIERYLGLPRLTRLVRALPSSSSCQWNFSTRVEARGDDDDDDDDPPRLVVVSDLLPLSDGSLCVIFQKSESSDSSPNESSDSSPRESSDSLITYRLALYSPEGVKRHERALEKGEEEMVMAEPGKCRFAVFFPISHTWQPGIGIHHTPTPTPTFPPHSPDDTQATRRRPQPPPSHPTVVFLERQQGGGGRTVVCEVPCPTPGHSASTTQPSVVFDLQDEGHDAIKVKASADGRYFAVLRGSQRVDVYQRLTPTSPSSSFQVTSELAGAELRDVCFGMVAGMGEMLMVAEGGAYNVILIVDHLHHQHCSLVAFLPSPTPRPSYVGADRQGRLWVGGEGGQVVVGVPVSQSQEDDYNLEEDEEGYLLPSIDPDLYVNIRLLGQQHCLSSPCYDDCYELTCPDQPQLPPRPAGYDTSRDTNSLGLPLMPPATPPVWNPHIQPALHRRFLKSSGIQEEGDDATSCVDPPAVCRPPTGRVSGGKCPPPPASGVGAAPKGSGYENMQCQPVVPRVGKSGAGRVKPPSPASTLPSSLLSPSSSLFSQSLPADAFQEHLLKKAWAPESMMQSPNRPPKPGQQEPIRPPKKPMEPKRPPNKSTKPPNQSKELWRPSRPGVQET
ncbi:hypothetical protein ACOMHN_055779 [Nucella lapillus]